MQKKLNLNFIISGALALLSSLFIIVIKTIDVQPIGPNQSSVGLATLNNYIFKLLGTDMSWYHITDLLGMITIIVAVSFGIVGLVQLVKRKRLQRVDKNIILLGFFYVVVLISYIIFEFFVVNYRPILLEGVLEASFPSSHTMLAVCIMSTAILNFNLLIKNKALRLTANTISVIMIGIIVIGRFISGVHWFTDIVGGLLISATFIMGYYSILKYIQFKLN